MASRLWTLRTSRRYLRVIGYAPQYITASSMPLRKFTSKKFPLDENGKDKQHSGEMSAEKWKSQPEQIKKNLEKQEEIMAVIKEQHDIVTAAKEPHDIIQAARKVNDVIKAAKIQHAVIQATKEQHNGMQSKQEQHEIIQASKVQHNVIKSTKEQHDVIKSTKEQHNVIKSTKEQHDVIKSTKERHDVIKSTKEQHDVMKSKKENTNIIASSKEHDELIPATKKDKDIITSSKELSDIIASEVQHTDLIRSQKDAVDIMTALKHNDEIMKTATLSEPPVLHIPVMAEEVMEFMKPKDGQIIFDLTFGAGGHTRQILAAAPGCTVYALDRDPNAHQLAKQLAHERGDGRLVPLLGRFSELPSVLSQLPEASAVTAGSVDAILMDLGASSMQFDQAERGFRLAADGPLDMRMDADRNPDQLSAADVVNTLDEVALARIFSKYGEEKHARSIATAIVESRSAFGDIRTTAQLTKIVNSVFSEGYFRHDKLRRHSHPATKTFQALRIFVNDELNELQYVLKLAHRLLTPGGVCIAISFHSLEDRLVKRAFSSRRAEDQEFPARRIDQNFDKRTMAERKYSKPLSAEDLQDTIEKRWADHEYHEPTLQEVERNPRARSAKLRVARKM